MPGRGSGRTAAARRVAALRAVPDAALPRHNLPEQLSSFVGRDSEVAEVVEELGRTRLLTLVGAGGSGKTRLALRAAAEALDRHPDGTWWLELAPVDDPQLVGPALARMLGVRPFPGQSDLDAAIGFLARRRALLLLDNCEHLLGACAQAAAAILRACPAVTVLATSREPLRVDGETEWRVPPLDDDDAVRLFGERAARVRRGFTVTADNAAALVRVCRRLDGMPLAIELAAARTRLLSVEQIADGLDDALHLLTGGTRTALPRNQTLRGSVDWSHALLAVDERTLFRRLGVFTGGFTLGVAAEVCGGAGLAGAAILDLLASLCEKSLVQVEERGAELRYRLLEPVRQYALERLRDAGEEERLRDRHLDAYLRLAGEIAATPFEAGRFEDLAVFDAEAANLRQAIERAAAGDPEKGLELCGTLAVWWHSRGLFTAGEAAYRRVLEAAGGAQPSSPRARVRGARAYLQLFAGHNDVAIALAEEALAEADAVEDEGAAVLALGVAAGVQVQPDPVGARPVLERCWRLSRVHGPVYSWIAIGQTLAASYLWADDAAGARTVLDELLPAVEAGAAYERRGHQWFCYAWGEYAAGRLAAARALLERALADTAEPNWHGLAEAYLWQLEADGGRAAEVLEPLGRLRDRMLEQGALMTLPWVMAALARVTAAVGQLEEARSQSEAAAALFGERAIHAVALLEVTRSEALRLLGDAPRAEAAAHAALQAADRIANPRLAACARLTLGRVAAGRRCWADAEQRHHEALLALVEHGYAVELPRALEALAEVAAGLGSHVEAARILGAARRVREEVGVVAWMHQQLETDALQTVLREALGAEGYAGAVAEGAGLPPAEAVAWLRRARGERRRPPGGWESLTPTEVEVARHVAGGLKNREIGERMFISPGTVKVHLSHIYAKLGTPNRAALAHAATQRLAPR